MLLHAPLERNSFESVFVLSYIKRTKEISFPIKYLNMCMKTLIIIICFCLAENQTKCHIRLLLQGRQRVPQHPLLLSTQDI